MWKGGCIAFTQKKKPLNLKRLGGKMKTLALLKSNLEWLTCTPPPNDEGVPWPVERKRTPFSIHLAACPDLIQPKSLLNPNLIPAN